MRTVPEWIGSSDDAPVPARVKLRIFEANDGRCHWTGKKIMPEGTEAGKRFRDLVAAYKAWKAVG